MYPQSQPNRFADSFAQVEPKSGGPLHYEGEAPQGAFSLIAGTEDDRMPKSKLETPVTETTSLTGW